jgi:hypothetical protein
MLEVRNIKLSLKIPTIQLNSVIDEIHRKSTDDKPIYTALSYQISNRFYIIRDKYVYTFFKSNSNLINHINITKVSSFDLVNHAIEYILYDLLAPLNIKTYEYHIDNVTACGNLYKTVNLCEIIQLLLNTTSYKIYHNKEKFPGLFVKLHKCTIILFHTGKLISIGCKSIGDIIESENEFKQAIKM